MASNAYFNLMSSMNSQLQRIDDQHADQRSQAMDSCIISSNTFGNNVQIYQGGVHHPSDSPQKKFDACRNALFNADPVVDRETLKSTKGQRTAGTCEWIRGNETYQSWLDGDSQCLWISGGPGKGKTMLSIFLTEELERRAQESKAAELLLFYFCTSDEKHNSALAVLRGLAYQLVRKHPTLATHVVSDFESPEKIQETLKSPNALWMVLKKLLQAPDLGTVFCVLDGLDECDDESSRLLVGKFCEYFLESSKPSGGQFKLAIVSRKIDKLDAFPQVKLDPDNDEHVNGDIRHFISSSVQRLERIQGFDNIRESVESTLLDRAQGTFLWAGFVMKELSEKKTCIEIEDTLKDIPKGLHAIYGRMLMRIEACRRAVIFDILRWVTMAVRPLTVRELTTAIHIPSTIKISSDQAILDYITLCGHILTIHDQQVSLIHQSARDYLLQKEADNNPILRGFQINAEEEHGRLTEVCLDCIEKSDLCDTSLDINDASVLQKSPLLRYAVMHWPEHASQCSDADNENLFSLSRAFFQENSSVRLHWWETYKKTKDLLYSLRKSSNPPLLHIASYFGIDMLARKLLTRNVGYKYLGFMHRKPRAANQKSENGVTALELAVYGGHSTIVQLLLANGADGKDSEALRWAADRGHSTIVQLLLANGADGKDSEALRWAADRGHSTIVQLLIDNGADGRNIGALRSAASAGHLAVVQLLIDSGADGKDSEALRWAADGGHLAVVQLLIDNGADPSII